jgi:ATP-dependent DNA helicase RecQ
VIDKAKAILNNIFGYDTFRPLQQEVIENVLNHKDTLVIMPTGGGKSLCYQIPALLFKGLTVVVSPLISLMKDQVEQLDALGIEAAVLNSSLSHQEYQDNTERIRRNEIRLLYLAPETLLMRKTLTLLSSLQLDCLTIDEAHCISEWGHDFRPEYRQLIEIRDRFPKAVCMALTATATPRVQKDIKESLQLETSNAFIASFNRKNLFLEIVPKTYPVEQTLGFLRNLPNQSGIIYCFSRRQVDELTEILAEEGFSVCPYHAGLPDEDRRRNQELFIRDDVQIIVATIAFGMGINKPNIRFILHYDLPKNIESYYQQIGRAGRDGIHAHCRLLFSYSDIQKIQYFIKQKDKKEQRIANNHLNALLELAESDECRRAPILQYFGEPYAVRNCEMCDNCLGKKSSPVNVTVHAQKFLSCVKKTNEMFGASHVIDVLRGSKSKKVLRFRHHKLSIHEIGKDLSKKEWGALHRQFLKMGLLLQDMDFGSLKLTPKGWNVLRGKEEVIARMKQSTETSIPYKTSDYPHDHDLFELLKKKRKAIADHANVPPYVIFPDRTLIEMATFFPQSEDSLLQLHGVGSVKVKKYGQSFLDLICGYCREHHIEENLKRGDRYRRRSSRRDIIKKRFQYVGEAYNRGENIEALQKEYQVKRGTILNHLYRYMDEGHSLRDSEDLLNHSALTSQIQENVLNTFDQLGCDQLRPVYEALDQQVTYDELYLLRVYYLFKYQENR